MQNNFFNYLVLTLSVLHLNATATIAQSKKSVAAALTNFPKGATPQEIGKKIAARYLSQPHQNFNRPTPPKVITYPETCTWYGALTFAKQTNDKVLTAKLAERFEPLFG